jgi:phospholipase C
MSYRCLPSALVASATTALTILTSPATAQPAAPSPSYKTAQQYIQHVIIFMQENRSFDSYFGTYPHADGIPKGTCVPLSPHLNKGKCVVPFHDVHDVNAGSNHGAPEEQADLDDGITTDRMDGFLRVQDEWKKHETRCPTRSSPKCNAKTDGIFRHDAVGYHTDAELSNYWAYAEHFVLQDHLFASSRSWSLPSHLYLTSEWSAVCTDWTQALSCETDPLSPHNPLKLGENATLPWVNLFQLLDDYGVTGNIILVRVPSLTAMMTR